jgi:acyl-CoA synthetase (AMP-forming)/AMP-acid ligase II
MNLADALASHARNIPDREAIAERGTSLGYGELFGRVRKIATYFSAKALPPHAIVGVALRDTGLHLSILYGLAQAGCVILPMDCRWTAIEKERVARHFGASLVLCERGDAPAPDIAVEIVDGDWLANVESLRATRTFSSNGDTPLLLSLSSGTTGRPKGPLIQHKHFLRRFMTHWINLGLNGRQRFMSATPLYFGGGRTFAMSVLFSGGTVVMNPPPYQPLELIAAVEQSRTTSLFLVPTSLRRLLEQSDADLAPLQRLDLLISSGAPLTPSERCDIKKRLCGNFFEYYASTEGGGISLLSPEDHALHPDSVGRPIFSVDVEVVDDADQPLPARQVGALRYRGPGVAEGYYRDAEASREAFRDGWFYPGDLAALNEQGYIFLRGRRKDVILRGGVNIYPAEIEATLMVHPAVAEAAVCAIPSAEFGEEIAAFVQLRDAVDAADLDAWCAERLAPYKRPKIVTVVDALPRNSAGKAIKSQLLALLPWSIAHQADPDIRSG